MNFLRDFTKAALEDAPVLILLALVFALAGCNTLGVTEYQAGDRNNICWELFDQYPRFTKLDGGRVVFHRGGAGGDINKYCPDIHDERKVRRHLRASR